MTRDEILAMKPGRELDALVAEKVMGWTYGHPCPGGMDCLHWADEKGKVRDYKPPQYSTDIAAAFEILDMFKGFEIVKHSYEVKVKVVRTGQMNIAYADSVPLAICRAALLAVMGE